MTLDVFVVSLLVSREGDGKEYALYLEAVQATNADHALALTRQKLDERVEEGEWDIEDYYISHIYPELLLAERATITEIARAEGISGLSVHVLVFCVQNGTDADYEVKATPVSVTNADAAVTVCKMALEHESFSLCAVNAVPIPRTMLPRMN